MSTVTKCVWDELSDCVLTELDAANAPQAVYANEPSLFGGVLSQRRDGATTTLHADALGTRVLQAMQLQ